MMEITMLQIEYLRAECVISVWDGDKAVSQWKTCASTTTRTKSVLRSTRSEPQ